MKNRHYLLILIGLLCLPMLSMAKIRITDMRVNGLDCPIGTDPDGKTVFSWILASDKNETFQEAYQVIVLMGVMGGSNTPPPISLIIPISPSALPKVLIVHNLHSGCIFAPFIPQNTQTISKSLLLSGMEDVFQKKHLYL